MSKKRLRKFPQNGTIICIPLPKEGYAYAVCAHGSLWIYNFTTDQPVFDPRLFISARWLQYISTQDDGVGVDTFDVGSVPLSADELKFPKTFHRIPEEAMGRGQPSPFKGYDPYARHVSVAYSYITAEELPQYQESLMFTPKQLLDYLEKNRHRLEKMEVLPSQIVSPKPSADAESFEPLSVFEIWLSELEKMTVTDTEGIAEEITSELEKHEAGEVIGSGQTEGQDQHNIAVQNAPGKNKQALACIRRVLKRLNADPATTDIWEQKSDAADHIEHSL